MCCLAFLRLLILQDLPDVIASVKDLPEAVKPMAHDFFTEQPSKDLTSNPAFGCSSQLAGRQVQKVLNNIIPAMQRGYSKIPINDIAIPDEGVDSISTAVDIIMLATFASRERTEADWTKLLESVGLRVLNIWTYERGEWSLIEAEPA
ncbi:hypothetical protein V8E51_012616 [Hyaloscypha variabilis]